MPAFIGKRLPVFFYLLKIILPRIRNPLFIKEIMVGEIRRILTQKKACLHKPLLLVVLVVFCEPVSVYKISYKTRNKRDDTTFLKSACESEYHFDPPLASKIDPSRIPSCTIISGNSLSQAWVRIECRFTVNFLFDNSEEYPVQNNDFYSLNNIKPSFP